MIVYLTGGIGVGKSTALDILSQFGARVLRADDIVHDLLREPEVQQAVAHAIGVADGGDRRVIAETVFGNERLLRKLEEVLHPLVAERFRDYCTRLPKDETLVYEVPLPPSGEPGEAVLLLTAPASVRLERLTARGMSPDDAQARMDAQPTIDAYRAVATHEIDNATTVDSLRAALTAFWKEVTRDPRDF